MTKKHLYDNKSDGKQKLRNKATSTISREIIAESPGNSFGKTEAAINLVGTDRFQEAQRIEMALQIGRLQGNKHLQDTITTNQKVIKPSTSRVATAIQQQPQPTSPAPATPTTSRTGYDAIQDFVEDSAEEWRLNKDHFDLALRNFQRRLTMTSEDEAVPDVAGALVKHVVDKITGAALKELETLIPGWGEVKGALDAMVGELDRAAAASVGLRLRDFLMNTDRTMTRGFEAQIRGVRNGRAGLRETYDSLASNPDIQRQFTDSFPNWLARIRSTVPSADEYEGALYLEWINLAYGTLSGYEPQGMLELKFNAETPGTYTFESAKVRSSYANKIASGLNWIFATPSLGIRNVLDLPIRKLVGLYCENIVGGTGYGWAQLGKENDTEMTPVEPVPRQRWNAMPWDPFQTINRISV